MKTPIKALSIKQPWASLIAHGIKNIENRTWKTSYRGRIYIHASQKPVPFTGLQNGVNFTTEQRMEIFKLHPPKDGRYPDIMSKYINGAIIGEVDIVDCVINHPSIWAEFTEGVAYNPKHYPNGVRAAFGYKGCVYNWVLENAVLYDEPILNVKGKLSLWEYNKEEII